MNVLMMSPVNFDEKSPFNHLLRSLMDGMISNGIRLKRMVTKIDGLARNDVIQAGELPVDYIYINNKAVEKSNFVKRYTQLWWIQLQMCRKLQKWGKIDVIFEDMSHASILPLLFGKAKKIPVVLMVQDVWPDNAVETGLIPRGGVVHRMFELLQSRVYKLAEKIVVISEDIKQLLIAKGVDGHKIEVVYNWGYSDEINEIAWSDNEFVKKYALSKKEFYVVYAGNIGMMQNIGVIIDAANLLARYEHIKILIVGDGVRKQEYVERVKRENLGNVKFIDMQPPEMAPHIYCAAGVNVIPLMPNGVKTALPSKTSICLSCGRPIVLCVEEDSKYAGLLGSYAAGVAVGPSNHRKLSEAILDYSKNAVPFDKESAFQCFRDHFLKSANVKKYCAVIRSCRKDSMMDDGSSLRGKSIENIAD